MAWAETLPSGRYRGVYRDRRGEAEPSWHVCTPAGGGAPGDSQGS